VSILHRDNVKLSRDDCKKDIVGRHQVAAWGFKSSSATHGQPRGISERRPKKDTVFQARLVVFLPVLAFCVEDRAMKKAVLAISISTLVLMAAAPGIRPRADANSYPEHREEADFSIGAFLLPHEQAKKMFKLDLNHAGYVVVEIGVFPAPGKDVDLNPADFMLCVGEKFAALRPVSADTIAEHVVGRPEPPRLRGPFDVNTSTGIYVGRGSYPETDPVTGRRTGRRTNRTVAGTEVGVGIGGPAPQPCRGYDCGPARWPCGGLDCEPTTPLPPLSQPSPVQTANAISQDLWENSLPDGKTVHPVAGYLYFAKPERKAKDAAWELRYENADVRTRLPLSK
jgi:hypothetical protein